MNVVFDKSFSKCLDKLNQVAIKKDIEDLVVKIDNEKSLTSINGIKKLKRL